MSFTKQQIEEYRALRNSNQVAFLHCPECLSQKPVDQTPAQWSRIELLVDVVTGYIYAGCARCELPMTMDEKEKIE